MSPDYEIVTFGTEAAAPAGDIASLHANLLPHSPVPLLGELFMKRVYYRILPREGLISGAVAYVDSQPAGFVVATHDTSGFMSAALRRHWPYILWIMGVSVLRDPKRFGAAWEAWRIMRSLPPPQDGIAIGEILSLGVLLPYRGIDFIKKSGIRISVDLRARALGQIAARGVRTVRAIVDEDNLEAQFFYHSAGWVQAASSVPGWRKPTVEFIWGD